jgi:hypothetical protein
MKINILPRLLMLWICFYGCTGPNVKTDFDASEDFTKFRTFAFSGLTDLNKGGVFDNSLTRTRIESIVGRELNKKGLQEVGSEQGPDLLVHYWVGVQEKQRVQSTGPAVGAYGWGGGYRGGMGYSNVSTYEYKEGTLIVDLVQPLKKELVWRATIVADLQDTTQENIKMGEKAVAKAFENYPPKITQ